MPTTLLNERQIEGEDLVNFCGLLGKHKVQFIAISEVDGALGILYGCVDPL